MIIRKSNQNDLPMILDIINDAKSFLFEQGLDQWQNGYPNEETISKDILSSNSYVLVDNDKIIATAAIIYGIDPNYENIYQGNWLNNDSYAVIHRIATKKEFKNCGCASKIINWVKENSSNKNIKSIRIDTHINNIPMQKMLEKLGFVKCGIIYLDKIIDSTHLRLAYEYIIN